MLSINLLNLAAFRYHFYFSNFDNSDHSKREKNTFRVFFKILHIQQLCHSMLELTKDIMISNVYIHLKL